MLKCRLIPVLLLKNSLLVRSEKFSIHQIIGNPIFEVKRFNEWNVDELIYLDITKNGGYDIRREDHRFKGLDNPLKILDEVSKTCFMPLTWGGNIKSISDMKEKFEHGADKVAINTCAFKNPKLIQEAAKKYGDQAIVVSIDSKLCENGKYEVYISGGKEKTGVEVVDWAKQAEELGAGEILLQSIDRDGTGTGYDVHIILLADGESSRGTDIQLDNSEQISARNLAAKEACKILGCKSVDILNLPDNRLDGLERLDIIKLIEEFIEKYRPSTVFTHHSGDVNIDHCVVHDAVITACRPQPDYHVSELLFFEVPSSTEWRPPGSDNSFNPNVFYDISSTLEIKMEAFKAYENELRVFPHPRSFKAIRALAEWRGASAGIEAAEAFILGRKVM